MSAVVVAGSTAALSMYSQSQANKAANRQSQAMMDNAAQRYAINKQIATEQMQELNSTAMEKMTEVTRAMLMAKGKQEVSQAETMVGGNVAARMKHNISLKASEQKSKIANEINTEIINIARQNAADSIDANAQIAEAKARSVTGSAALTSTLLAGASGALSGYQLTNAIKQS